MAPSGCFVSQSGKPERKLSPTILLVDADLGFVFWLGQALDAAGYNAVPAVNTQAATELIQEHKLSVSVLVIDPSLPDALGFISRLRNSKRMLNVVAAIPDDWGKLPPLAEVNAVIRKPRRLTSVTLTQWLNLIESFCLGMRVDCTQAHDSRLKKVGPGGV